jgi:hypothetical protein
MATEPITSAVPAVPPLQAWLARLGWSGKLLAAGGLVGALAVFLPLVSVSMQMPTGAGTSLFGGKGGASLPASSTHHSVLVVQDLRGILCLFGYAAALALTFVLYRPSGLGQKALGWAGAGVGGFTALLALWLLVGAFGGSSNLDFFGASFRVSVGVGAFLNVLAAGVGAAGGFLKAREEKLI